MKIGITGLAASGKGTIARLLAQKLCIDYVDLGLIFRAVSYIYSLRNFADLNYFAQTLNKELMYIWNGVNASVSWNDTDITQKLHDQKISALTSRLAANKSMLDIMVNFSQELSNHYKSIVADGRNIGITLLVDADVIFCIEADITIRAHRRYRQLLQQNSSITFDEIFQGVRKRDQRDCGRKDAPYVMPSTSILIRSDYLSVEECTHLMLRYLSQYSV